MVFHFSFLNLHRLFPLLNEIPQCQQKQLSVLEDQQGGQGGQIGECAGQGSRTAGDPLCRSLESTHTF